jgi:hypothetical protein
MIPCLMMLVIVDHDPQDVERILPTVEKGEEVLQGFLVNTYDLRVGYLPRRVRKSRHYQSL